MLRWVKGDGKLRNGRECTTGRVKLGAELSTERLISKVSPLSVKAYHRGLKYAGMQ
jgi:hypothetical protein